jgi:cysteine desulfurase family protein (TIGR01976 family)
MTYRVASVRSRFPALAEGAAHFDGPGGSLVPDAVGTAVASTLTSAIANRGRLTAAERRADGVVVEARRAVADLLGADPGGVVFGRSMTSLTYEFAATLAKRWAPGDEVVVTRLDHDANIRPWVQSAARAGAAVRWADFDRSSGELPTEAVTDLIGPRTRLVAVTAASNLVATRPDVATITAAARNCGALTYIDGVHLTPHSGVDVAGLGADFYACSPYKWMGPHCGVVVAAPELLQHLDPDKLLPSSDAGPERFELGTLPYELLAGVTAAVDFIAGIADIAGVTEITDTAGVAAAAGLRGLEAPTAGGRRGRLAASMAAIEGHEHRLLASLEERLDAVAGLVRHGRPRLRTPTVLTTFGDVPPPAVAEALAAAGVNAPAGSFYALEASRHLGLGDGGGLRIGLAPYTDETDVDRLVAGIEGALRELRPARGPARG